MSASSVAIAAGPSVHARRLKAVALTGPAAALAALAGFGSAHALIITPIWSQLLRGLPFALIGGVGLAWAFDVLAQLRPSAVRSSTAGVKFGAVMFAALGPGTAIDTGLRLTGMRRADTGETAVAMVAAAISGALVGWLWTRHRDGAIAFAGGAVALLLASAGPLPVAQSARGLWLSVAIAGICMVAGIAIALSRRLFHLDTP